MAKQGSVFHWGSDWHQYCITGTSTTGIQQRPSWLISHKLNWIQVEWQNGATCCCKLNLLGLTSSHSSSWFVHVQKCTISTTTVSIQTPTHKRTQACSFVGRSHVRLHRADQVISCKKKKKKRIMCPIEDFEHAYPLCWTKESSIHLRFNESSVCVPRVKPTLKLKVKSAFILAL